MNKSILLSVKPEQAVKILNGKQTLLLQKRVPKDFVGWVYIYVTKARPLLQKKGNVFIERESYARAERIQNIVNGKVVARFWFDESKLIVPVKIDADWTTYIYKYVETNKWVMLERHTPPAEIKKYLKGKKGYVWLIKKLEIFDEPKELHEFMSPYDPITFVFGLKNRPTTWRYVWRNEDE